MKSGRVPLNWRKLLLCSQKTLFDVYKIFMYVCNHFCSKTQSKFTYIFRMFAKMVSGLQELFHVSMAVIF